MGIMDVIMPIMASIMPIMDVHYRHYCIMESIVE